MFCIKCGEKLPETAEFCIKCGTKTVDNQKESTDFSSLQPCSNQTNPVNQQQPKKNTLLYVILGVVTVVALFYAIGSIVQEERTFSVQNGYSTEFSNITYGEALDYSFTNTSWNTYEGNNGRWVSEFAGTHKVTGEEYRFQFESSDDIDYFNTIFLSINNKIETEKAGYVLYELFEVANDRSLLENELEVSPQFTEEETNFHTQDDEEENSHPPDIEVPQSNYTGNSTVLNYDFSYATYPFYGLEIPDLISVATEGVYFTEGHTIQESSMPNTFEHSYEETFADFIPYYVSYLKEYGFIATMDGYEGFYSLEKEVGNYLVRVNTYFDYEIRLVKVQITLNYLAQSQLSSSEIENEVTKIREIYNEIMSNKNKGEYLHRDVDNSVEAFFNGSYQNLSYVIVPQYYHEVKYARHYYFDDNELVFVFYEGTDSHRLYFKNGSLFRLLYTDELGNATNYEYATSDLYLELEQFALMDSADLLSRALQ